MIDNGGTYKKSTKSVTLKETGDLPTCSTYLKKDGYTCAGWYIYKEQRSGAKYLSSNYQWTSFNNAGKFKNGFNLSNIKSKLSDISSFYIKAVWVKK